MIVFDAEIARAIPDKGADPIPGIEYCKGWTDYAGMGAACVCTMDTRTGLARVFLEDNLQDLEAYLAEDITAGFNSLRFDIALLRAHAVSVPEFRHWDLFVAIKEAFGVKPQGVIPKHLGSWKLDEIARHTLNERKSGDGTSAPLLWQAGKRGQVIDYCARDVFLTATLIRCAEEGMPLTNGVASCVVQLPA